MTTPVPERRKYRATFREVLHNCDDQVIVRALLEEILSTAQKQEIVRRFNQDVDRYNSVLERQLQEIQS